MLNFKLALTQLELNIFKAITLSNLASGKDIDTFSNSPDLYQDLIVKFARENN